LRFDDSLDYLTDSGLGTDDQLSDGQVVMLPTGFT
jgi:hypothetical protein